jgi:hypothetical protein
VHEGYADNALNIKSMNINPGGKQKKLQDTRIPLNNPGPAPGEEDTHRHTIQSIIEDAGHVCLFLPWFHCKLNAIEMLWGYAKFCACVACCMVIHLIFCFSGYCDSADGKFNTAKALVSQCLDSCNVITICKFF